VPRIETSLRFRKWLFVIPVLIIAGWIGWPYYSFYKLAVAFRAGDIPALESGVAWDSVRQGLRSDLNAAMALVLSTDANTRNSGPRAALFTGLAGVMVPAMVNQVVEGYVTPQAIAAFNPDKDGAQKENAANPPLATFPQIIQSVGGAKWDQVEYMFFSGDPFTFKVQVRPERDPPLKSPFTLIFNWSGRWKLTHIMLSSDAFEGFVGPKLTDVPVVAQPQASEAKEDDALLKRKQDYIKNLEIYDFKAQYRDSLLDGRIPGVEFKIKNKGTETLDEVKVTVYFKDAKGNTIAEENYYPVLVSKFNITSDNKPLKPNYIWQMERGKFYTAKSVPSEWKEGAAEIRITDLQFEGESTSAEKQKLGVTPARPAPTQTGESTSAETDRPIAAAIPPTLPATARAKLYEEEPNNPYGRSYDGSVTWRIETVAAGQFSIHADITIPQRQMNVVWTLRRNTDPALPASHTIEIIFNRDIGNVPGMLMKASEQARGTPLAALGVKVKEASFSFGLSPDKAQHNVELLKDEPWLDIPFVYSNGHRAIIAVEKGETGNRLLAQAFLSWGQ
jgi:hypothetical protein